MCAFYVSICRSACVCVWRTLWQVTCLRITWDSATRVHFQFDVPAEGNSFRFFLSLSNAYDWPTRELAHYVHLWPSIEVKGYFNLHRSLKTIKFSENSLHHAVLTTILTVSKAALWINTWEKWKYFHLSWECCLFCVFLFQWAPHIGYSCQIQLRSLSSYHQYVGRLHYKLRMAQSMAFIVVGTYSINQ